MRTESSHFCCFRFDDFFDENSEAMSELGIRNVDTCKTNHFLLTVSPDIGQFLKRETILSPSPHVSLQLGEAVKLWLSVNFFLTRLGKKNESDDSARLRYLIRIRAI